MSKSIKKTQKDILSGQLDGGETLSENLNSENEKLINEAIARTPFRLIGSNEHGYRICIGINALTESYETADEALNALESEKWTIMANLIVVVMNTNRMWKAEYEQYKGKSDEFDDFETWAKKKYGM